MNGARHLYLHLPFCSARCGYCDFVTVVGRRADHAGYVDAVLQELALEHAHVAPELETIYLGGGTPTFTEPDALEHLLRALPACDELTVEANPETVTPELAALLTRNRVDRVSIGAQSFHTRLLDVLERRATPEDVRRAVHRLRDAGIGNISIDLIYGIPGEKPADLARDLAEIVELAPEHVSAYELEAKPGTRFTHAHGDELAQQAEALEGSFEAVVDALTAAGYRWYETANFCLTAERVGGRDLRARHNLGYWRGEDYLGIGVGAVSTIENRRWRNAPSLTRYVAALADGQTPPREVEDLGGGVRGIERVMLGLRLDEPLPLDGLGAVLDGAELERLEHLGLVARHEEGVVLTRRGRFVGGAVTARVLV